MCIRDRDQAVIIYRGIAFQAEGPASILCSSVFFVQARRKVWQGQVVEDLVTDCKDVGYY